MCGRYTLTLPFAEIAGPFGVEVPERLSPRYNAAPGQAHPVITCTKPGKLQLINWGFPLDNLGKSQLVINARQESLDQKPMFSDKLHSGRCLIPADGFYEWEKRDGKRYPLRFVLKDRGLFAFAGLFGTFENSIMAFTIITTGANELVKGVHNRMPLMLLPHQALQWLQAEEPRQAVRQLQPVAAEAMTSYPVSPRVNQTANDSPELIQPWKDPGLTLF